MCAVTLTNKSGKIKRLPLQIALLLATVRLITTRTKVRVTGLPKALQVAEQRRPPVQKEAKAGQRRFRRRKGGLPLHQKQSTQMFSVTVAERRAVWGRSLHQEADPSPSQRGRSSETSASNASMRRSSRGRRVLHADGHGRREAVLPPLAVDQQGFPSFEHRAQQDRRHGDKQIRRRRHPLIPSMLVTLCQLSTR